MSGSQWMHTPRSPFCLPQFDRAHTSELPESHRPFSRLSIPFSAFWLRSSVVSVRFILISETRLIESYDNNLIFWARGLNAVLAQQSHQLGPGIALQPGPSRPPTSHTFTPHTHTHTHTHTHLTHTSHTPHNSMQIRHHLAIMRPLWRALHKCIAMSRCLIKQGHRASYVCLCFIASCS